jgi:hypothetical protein
MTFIHITGRVAEKCGPADYLDGRQELGPGAHPVAGQDFSHILTPPSSQLLVVDTLSTGR